MRAVLFGGTDRQHYKRVRRGGANLFPVQFSKEFHLHNYALHAHVP